MNSIKLRVMLFTLLASLPVLEVRGQITASEQATIDTITSLGGVIEVDEFDEYDLELGSNMSRANFAKAIAEAASLPSLLGVYIDNNHIIDSDLEALKDISYLDFVRLRGSRISDDGMKHLGKMTQLDNLELYCDAITIEGLKHLGGLKSLRNLNISECDGVVEEGIADLKVLSNLVTPVASDTGEPLGYLTINEDWSASTYDKIKAAHPRLSISYD